ncbi:eukaryotic translation initiation factor 2A-like isoform X2 [Eriocheir sinensis]|uniref:eukaryotic translation initiation factor 2A-like isoform X2 n=1 Tax=Eriocheir sinensis TaxID=95602 RepID=UPI0021CA00FF|nr:eukaryotic translation initiation factor 2A-like isoform X2 [Eriocheir sinensis]
MRAVACHTNGGIIFSDGKAEDNEDLQGRVKTFIFSQDGSKIAWIKGGQVHLAESPDWTKIGSLKHPRAQEICFSSQGNYLAVWESYVKTTDQSQVQPNLSVYDVCGKKLLKAFFQQSQINWEPQWTHDETIFARNVTNEVHFYKADDLQNIAVKKILPKVRSFSLSPSTQNHHVTFFVPGAKGSPAYVHLYRYPNFQDTTSALANKSFFKADSVTTLWNKQSTACLLLTAAEVDKSGTSYYGEQMLFYLNIQGDSTRITFTKSGNIHSVCWSPNGQEFFAVYGTMPSKATMFNQKCEVVAEFGEGARNTVSVNPVGNIVLVGGFGNISPRYEMWDIKLNKKIGETECPDTTHHSWSPCGQYLLTSTCYARLKVNNGYKVWHYTAVLQQETSHEELYEASWVPCPDAAQPFAISTKPVSGISSSTAVASKQRYIPPSQRGGKGIVGATNTEKKFLSQMDNPPKEEAPQQLSKAALKNKKKREAAKKKREEEGKDETSKQSTGSASTEPGIQSCGSNVELTGNPEKDKKIRNIKKKLNAIAKLKGELESGKTLEKDQLEKIATEEKLMKDLEDLVI